MAERLTMKALSEELETLRKRLRKLETDIERRLDQAVEKAVHQLKFRTDTGMQGVDEEPRRHGRAVDVDARRRLIAEGAYLRAERRGFVGGSPEQDWLEAEREVDHLLLQGWANAANGRGSDSRERHPDQR